jgi:hypothetical protein
MLFILEILSLTSYDDFAAVSKSRVKLLELLLVVAAAVGCV